LPGLRPPLNRGRRDTSRFRARRTHQGELERHKQPLDDAPSASAVSFAPSGQPRQSLILIVAAVSSGSQLSFALVTLAIIECAIHLLWEDNIAEQASAVYPGKRVVGTLSWERER